jgi:[acyl-carrier-protein] S-malonyltransferase
MENLAFIFPGQGSQSVGMINDIYSEHQLVKDTFVEASDVLSFDLTKLIFEGPVDVLNRTNFTQPAILATSIALFRLWQENSEQLPVLLAGHSLGEYSALVCSGVITFADALTLVRRRGELMLEAVPLGIGAMVAILGLDTKSVENACKDSEKGQVVSAVNYNSPGQIVIAGNKEAVDRAVEKCKALGAKRALPLPVSAPFHCELMSPASIKLEAELAKLTFSKPQIPIINNVDVKIETETSIIRDALVRQLYSPVRWTETIQLLIDKNITTMVECGPGKVLSGLNKRIDRNISAMITTDLAGFNKSLEVIG